MWFGKTSVSIQSGKQNHFELCRKGFFIGDLAGCVRDSESGYLEESWRMGETTHLQSEAQYIQLLMWKYTGSCSYLCGVAQMSHGGPGAIIGQHLGKYLDTE